jgi:hypothetical protein
VSSVVGAMDQSLHVTLSLLTSYGFEHISLTAALGDN